MYKPDYKNLRSERPFSWFATGVVNALLELTGIPQKEFFLEPSAGIELLKKGARFLRKSTEATSIWFL